MADIKFPNGAVLLPDQLRLGLQIPDGADPRSVAGALDRSLTIYNQRQQEQGRQQDKPLINSDGTYNLTLFEDPRFQEIFKTDIEKAPLNKNSLVTSNDAPPVNTHHALTAEQMQGLGIPQNMTPMETAHLLENALTTYNIYYIQTITLRLSTEMKK